MVWPFGSTRQDARGPDGGSQRTARNAIIAAGLLVVVFTLGAYSCSGHFVATSAMERYIKLGPRQGPSELERDLLRSYPPGSGIGPLFEHLGRQGFDCAAALQPGRGGDCRFRTKWGDGRVATMLVTVAHDGVQIRGIAARMSIGN
jgi:hypothetical protein